MGANMSNSTASKNSESQAAPQAGNPRAEQRRLEILVGTWKTVGTQYETELGPSAKVEAIETYEWLKGGMFLVHRFEGHLDTNEMACIEMIEADPSAEGRYRLHTYYNDGRSNDWKMDALGSNWVLSGHWQNGRQSLQVRCTLSFEDNGHKRLGKWECSLDGSRWQTFWEVTSTRLVSEVLKSKVH
jgi:hypothetical protein